MAAFAVGPGDGGPVIGRSFGYRVDGAVTDVLDMVAGTSRRIEVDVAGRVVGVSAAGWTEGYAYDPTGRVTSDAVGGDLAGGPLAPRTYDGTQVRRGGAVSYRHDRQGRMVTRSRRRLSRPPETWQFRYDTDDRLVEATCADQHWAYIYDAFGRRISKQRVGVGGEVLERTLFSWDGNRLVEQARTASPGSAATVTTWEYAPGSWTPITQTVTAEGDGDGVDAEFYAIVSDLVGAPTELVTADGRRVAWTNADGSVWGAPRHKTGNVPGKFNGGRVDCPIRFPGQYADDETGLHYNRHRYYDPTAGRYSTADPLGLAPADDPHGYVLNPTGWADPLGLTPCTPGANSASSSGIPALADSGRIDPATVRFSQDKISANFRNGGSVDELAVRLRTGDVDPESITPIRIFERDGLIHTLDNRRLAAFQQAQVHIPYVLAKARDVRRDAWKFDTRNGGVSITMRGRS